MKRKFKNFGKKVVSRARVVNKPKVFGIGNNKTGTTSLKRAMQELGFVVGEQRDAEKLAKEWAIRDFRNLIKYCRTAEFFQDIPFSNPYTYIILDHEFPNSKFILTIRDDAELWYHSLTKFHAKKWGKDGQIPTKEDLQKASYIWKGFPWDLNRWKYNSPENEPYNKLKLIEQYENHNKSVIEYFRHRPQDLLVLNLSDPNAYSRLCDFLGVKSEKTTFPWENKTATL